MLRQIVHYEIAHLAQHGVIPPLPMIRHITWQNAPTVASVTGTRDSARAKPCLRGQPARDWHAGMIVLVETDVFLPRPWRGWKIQSSGCTSTDICSEVNAYQTPWAVLWVLMYPQPKVAVSWTGGVGSVCIVSGNNIQVTFLQDFGDLPHLISGGTNLGQTSGTDPPLITAQKVVTGDKESDICSSHGTCDEDKGICQCLDDWMTSDGYGMLVLGVIAAIDPRVQHLLAQENQHVSAMGLALGHQLTDATVRAEGVGPIVL